MTAPEIDSARVTSASRIGDKSTETAPIIAETAPFGNPETGEGKQLATFKAELALHHGVSLWELSDGSFLASKWNLTRPLRDLHAVANFARQLGGTQ